MGSGFLLSEDWIIDLGIKLSSSYQTIALILILSICCKAVKVWVEID